MDEEIECKTRVEIHCALVVNTTKKIKNGNPSRFIASSI